MTDNGGGAGAIRMYEICVWVCMLTSTCQMGGVGTGWTWGNLVGLDGTMVAARTTCWQLLDGWMAAVQYVRDFFVNGGVQCIAVCCGCFGRWH